MISPTSEHRSKRVASLTVVRCQSDVTSGAATYAFVARFDSTLTDAAALSLRWHTVLPSASVIVNVFLLFDTVTVDPPQPPSPPPVVMVV